MNVSHLGSNLSRLTLFALLTRLDMIHERDACHRNVACTLESTGRRCRQTQIRGGERGVERPMKSLEVQGTKLGRLLSPTLLILRSLR